MSTRLSTNTIIYLISSRYRIPLAAVQSLTINENVERDPQMLSIVSRKTYSGTLERVVFDDVTLKDLFVGGNTDLSKQQEPFDIWVIEEQTDSTKYEMNAPTTKFRRELQNCWVTGVKQSYCANDFVITESLDFIAERLTLEEHTSSDDFLLRKLTEDERIIKDIIE